MIYGMSEYQYLKWIIVYPSVEVYLLTDHILSVSNKIWLEKIREKQKREFYLQGMCVPYNNRHSRTKS